jgi:hypothetical protein
MRAYMYIQGTSWWHSHYQGQYVDGLIGREYISVLMKVPLTTYLSDRDLWARAPGMGRRFGHDSPA